MRKKFLIAIAAIICILVLGVFLSELTTRPVAAGNDVTLCHATGSNSNPFVQIIVSPAGAYNGHLGGGHQNGEDIIPPFVWQGQTYSQNWDTNGQAIWNNECEIPQEPTATNTAVPPTSTAVPPTATSQPGPSPTATATQPPATSTPPGEEETPPPPPVVTETPMAEPTEEVEKQEELVPPCPPCPTVEYQECTIQCVPLCVNGHLTITHVVTGSVDVNVYHYYPEGTAPQGQTSAMLVNNEVGSQSQNVNVELASAPLKKELGDWLGYVLLGMCLLPLLLGALGLALYFLVTWWERHNPAPVVVPEQSEIVVPRFRSPRNVREDWNQ